MNQRPRFKTTRLLAVSAILGLSMLSACQSGPSTSVTGPVYPEEKSLTATLDVQVIRDETTIRMTNTTARSFGKSRVWLNKWFSRDIESFEVGQTLEFNLSEFRDQYGEAFRAGGFFAIKKPERLVLAQLETADTLVGLVVVARGEE